MAKKYLLLVLAICLLYSCKKRKTEEAEEDTFDRTAMLTSYAVDIISPSLAEFEKKSDSLYISILAFSSNPNLQSLDSVQSSLRKTAISWQYCSAFRIGPVIDQFGSIDDVAKREDYINTYPVNTSAIENFISKNYTSLADVDFPSRGLNAMDYLLNSLNENDSTIVNKFSSSNARKEYLKTLALDIKNRTSNAYAGWQSYRDEFISNNGTSATSSAANFILQFIIDFETLKNYEIGIPVGRILSSIGAVPPKPSAPEPTRVQFYYMGNSLELTKHHFLAIERNWHGKDSKGLKLYLEYADGGLEVSEATLNQMNQIKNVFTLIPNERLSILITTNKQPVSDYYAEIQKLTHLIKSELTSKIGIYITYSTGDGD